MTPTLPALPDNLFWESRTAETLGISRTRLRWLRKNNLQAETDWTLRENAVVLTAAGVAKITAILRAEGQSPASGAEHPAKANGGPVAVPPGPLPKAIFMVVRVPAYRTDRPQKNILICRQAPAAATQIAPWELSRYAAQLDAQERPIRVRDNSHFLPGMILEAAQIGHGMWQYLGRLPRRPGRW